MPTLIVMTQWQMLTFQNVFQNVIRQKKTKPIYPTVHYSIILSACHFSRNLHFGTVLIFKALSADTDDVTMLSCMMHR